MCKTVEGFLNIITLRNGVSQFIYIFIHACVSHLFFPFSTPTTVELSVLLVADGHELAVSILATIIVFFQVVELRLWSVYILCHLSRISNLHPSYFSS